MAAERAADRRRHLSVVARTDRCQGACIGEGTLDYWIVNLVDRELEVYRDPVAAPLAPFGWQYGPRQALTATGTIAALVVPSAGISVADLMP